MEKRYTTYDCYVKKTFGGKVAKIGLDGGFTCPNRDGTKGWGGCVFCAEGGAENRSSLPLKVQYQTGRERVIPKWGDLPAIGYLQSFTSTYAPAERLRQIYREILSFPRLVGINIGTRPDCLPEETLELLKELNEKTHLVVELGLQTVHDSTARRINRGHGMAEFLEGYDALKRRGIRVGVHLINGLPGETREMMVESGRVVGQLRPDFVKLHGLYLRKGTALAKEYEEGRYTPMTFEEYTDTVCDQIELLPPETVVERVTGDGKREEVLAPLWSLGKIKVINCIDKKLEKRDSRQGICYSCTKNDLSFLKP